MLDAATSPAPTHPAPDVVKLNAEAHTARVEEPVTFVSVLPVTRKAVQFVADLLQDHWRQLGTRPERRALDS